MVTDGKVRVLIVDDHPVVRKGIRAVLEMQPDIMVLGEASNGVEALDKCRELRPDIILLDISMPEMNGLEVAGRVKDVSPNTKVILLTMHEEEEYFFQALAVGASGYMVKGDRAEELVSAIASVHSGGVYLEPALARELVNDDLRAKSVTAFEGLTNRQIAEALYISVTTVQTHRAHLMEKLDLHSQTDLIKYAIRKGILKPS